MDGEFSELGGEVVVVRASRWDVLTVQGRARHLRGVVCSLNLTVDAFA